MIQPRLRIQSGSPADGKVLTSDPVGNATWESAPLKGVVAGHGLATEGAGTKTSPLMVKLIDANTDGQFLKWNNTTGQWELAPGYTGTAPITVSAANAISLNDRGVTNAKLRDDAVNSAKIEDNTVTSLDILDGTITGTDIANTTITQAKLVGGTAGQVLTATGAATAPTWQAVPADPDNIVGNEVVGATLNGGLIRAGTPTAANPYTLGIAQQGVQTGMLADQAVTSIKIADGTIVNADISNNTIQADRLTGTGSSSGMVLTSSGPGTAPVWSTVYSGGVSGQVIEAGSSAAICLNAPATFTSGTTLEVIAEGSGIIVSQISTTFPGGFYNASGREGQLYDAPWVIGYSAPSYSLPRGSVIFVICALTRTRVNASWRVTPY
ncbi:hypothetical protein IR083_10340 [Dysgonomonas sp. GY75]|uniref:hypothetical protein n=1 Tax=Dysgonomonas sp. GY75 TaxID=2780419 RepID=UPI00188454A3|nr:hypothetical protein [Dysgonomonas sp. GY75]MBF0649220.1 hypothetical protein [Dysgonomonas sp. GY75]